MIELRNTCLLASYRMWADQLTFEAVARLPQGEANKRRRTPLNSILGTLNHIYVVDRIWQAHLEGHDHGFETRDLMLHERLPELWNEQRSVNQWFLDWSERLTELSLNETIHFRFIDGKQGVMTQREILMHVVNHATYHRGWIAEMFFQVPAAHPMTDLSVYLCEPTLGRIHSNGVKVASATKVVSEQPLPVPRTSTHITGDRP